MEDVADGEHKMGEAVNVVRYEYLSDSDEDIEYEAVPESEDDDDEEELFNLGGEDTLAAIERSVSRTKRTPTGKGGPNFLATESDERVEASSHSESTEAAESKHDGAESKTVVRPAVVDDFFRSFLIKLGMARTLDSFNTEWYELESKGKLNEEQVGPVPDIYLRNDELNETVRTLRVELDRVKQIAEKAQSTWDKFRKERDFHRLHHKRVVQEKNKLIDEIKRVKKHYQAYEPTIKQLRQKYELAMKEKMLMKIERDKFAARNDSLELQVRTLEHIEDGDGVDDRSSSGQVNLRKGGSAKSLLKAPSGSSTRSRKPGSTIRPRGVKSGKAGAAAAPGTMTGLPKVDPVNPFLSEVLPAPAVTNMQMLKTFEGHMNAVSALAYHPKRQVIATASDDHTWKLWSVPNGDLIMSGEGHQDWVSGIDFNPRGTHLLSCSGDGTVKLWDFERAQCTATLTDHAQPVWDVAWHYSGDFFASCSMDHTAKLWDVERLSVRQTFRDHVDSVNALAFQPFSSNLCTASGDKTVSMWDSRSGLCIQTFYGHSNACNSLALNMRGDTIASCDADGVVKLWDVRMVKELYTLESGSHALNDISFDRSGAVLAAASDDGTVKLFDAVQGQSITQLRGHDDAVQAVAFDPSSKFFVSASSDKTFRVWKL